MLDTRPPFRVLILNTPTLLGDLLTEAMTQQADFTVIRERDFTRAEYATAAPEIVVVGRPVPDQEHAASVLLARWPRSIVVMIEDGRRGGLMVRARTEKKPRRRPVSEGARSDDPLEDAPSHGLSYSEPIRDRHAAP